jgi:iron complex transport system permease protein
MKQALRGSRLTHGAILGGMVGGLVLIILLAVSFGSVVIPFPTIVQIFLRSCGFPIQRNWDESVEVIILQVRLPVVLGAVCVGMGLSVAGVLFQSMLRNPLADPFLIGTSSGAALGAVIALMLPLGTATLLFLPVTPVFAFLGALLTVLLVYGLAHTEGKTPVVTLLLAGVVMNAVLVAIQTLILTLSPRSAVGVQVLFNWLSGGLSVNGWLPVIIVSVLIVPGILWAWGLSNTLDALALGEEGASFLGIHVERVKLVLVVVASLLTAAAVSISGLIGFVGLVTPHVMRLLLGPRHRLLIPASALGGAIFLTLSDLLARTVIAPAVIPVGVFTALVGAPFFLFLLRRRKREYQW